ncbi:MAG TPA: hypothetical protein VF954_04585, partial [Acidimicrobiales bacterium]
MHLDDGDVTLPALRVPPAAGFDPALPDLGLGIPVTDLDRVARALLARLWGSVAGDDGFLASALLGLRHGFGDLPADWPVPELPAGGLGALLADPLGVLRTWLTRLLLDLSVNRVPFALGALDGLRRLLSPGANADLGAEGAGTRAAPWRVDLADPGSSQLLLWLEPDGPPAAWATDAADQATDDLTGDGLLALMSRVGQPLAPLAALFGGPQGPSTPDRLSDAFAALVSRCSDGDGVVPLAAQFPDDSAWALGETLVDAAHHRLPEHAD